MKEESSIPRFVSVVAIALGCLDLIRGFMHTLLLDYAATNIAGFDLTTSSAGDLLRQMGAFGISNYLTGAMLILIGWKARFLALTMLGIIPVAYGIGRAGIRINTAAYGPSQADWGGASMMIVYLIVCAITCVTGIIMTQRRRKRDLTVSQEE